MISYFYEGKGSLSCCEDSLTSLLFDLMKYLPDDIFWKILNNSLEGQKLPNIYGEILEISFWEKWDPEKTTNSNFVEPDVFIRTSEFDVLVEAKKSDKNRHNSNQIDNEIQAYINEFSKDSKKLYFIQLGGVNEKIQKDNTKYEIEIIHCKTNWTRILEQIVYEINHLEQGNCFQINSYKRILDDLIKGFELHGYFRMMWLKDLNYVSIKRSKEILFKYAK